MNATNEPLTLTAGELAELTAAAILETDRAAAHEQSTRGVESLAETDISDLIAKAALAAGLGVARERGLPVLGDHAPAARDRERCDLVLWADAGARLRDPVADQRETERASGTLFESLAEDMVAAAPARADWENRVDTGGRVLTPEDATWAELKIARQFVAGASGVGPNRGYERELIEGPAADGAKLAHADGLGSRCVLLVAFVEAADPGEADLVRAVHAWLDRGIPAGSPEVRRARITDRIGHAWALAAAVPIRPLD